MVSFYRGGFARWRLPPRGLPPARPFPKPVRRENSPTLNFARVTMLQASPHCLFKRICLLAKDSSLEHQSAELLQWLRKRACHVRRVASVCTGALEYWTGEGKQNTGDILLF